MHQHVRAAVADKRDAKRGTRGLSLPHLGKPVNLDGIEIQNIRTPIFGGVSVTSLARLNGLLGPEGVAPLTARLKRITLAFAYSLFESTNMSRSGLSVFATGVRPSPPSRKLTPASLTSKA